MKNSETESLFQALNEPVSSQSFANAIETLSNSKDKALIKRALQQIDSFEHIPSLLQIDLIELIEFLELEQHTDWLIIGLNSDCELVRSKSLITLSYLVPEQARIEIKQLTGSNSKLSPRLRVSILLANYIITASENLIEQVFEIFPDSDYQLKCFICNQILLFVHDEHIEFLKVKLKNQLRSESIPIVISSLVKAVSKLQSY